jgi:hypothetical protein
MNSKAFALRLAEICREPLPLPAKGKTPLRHRRLMEVGREDVSVAKLAEAHWDALAILAEAGREPEPNAIYGVWASAVPGSAVTLESGSNGLRVAGRKEFCSGAGLIDRALVTIGSTDTLLVEIDMLKHLMDRNIDTTSWHTDAFRLTQTATVTFESVPIQQSAILGPAD